MLQFNQEILGLQPSKSMTFMAKARQLQAADPEVVNHSGLSGGADVRHRWR